MYIILQWLEYSSLVGGVGEVRNHHDQYSDVKISQSHIWGSFFFLGCRRCRFSSWSWRKIVMLDPVSIPYQVLPYLSSTNWDPISQRDEWLEIVWWERTLRSCSFRLPSAWAGRQNFGLITFNICTFVWIHHHEISAMLAAKFAILKPTSATSVRAFTSFARGVANASPKCRQSLTVRAIIKKISDISRFFFENFHVATAQFFLFFSSQLIFIQASSVPALRSTRFHKNSFFHTSRMARMAEAKASSSDPIQSKIAKVRTTRPQNRTNI